MTFVLAILLRPSFKGVSPRRGLYGMNDMNTLISRLLPQLQISWPSGTILGMLKTDRRTRSLHPLTVQGRKTPLFSNWRQTCLLPSNPSPFSALSLLWQPVLLLQKKKSYTWQSPLSRNLFPRLNTKTSTTRGVCAASRPLTVVGGAPC